MKTYEITLDKVNKPQYDHCKPVELNAATIDERKKKVLKLMKKRDLDAILVYGDLEHGSNFEYLVGFLPRFEEALLVLLKDGSSYLILGNENIGKAQYSRIPVTPIHAPILSLPNQPMDKEVDFKEIFMQAKIAPNSRVGVVGWKLFTSKIMNNEQLFDLPYYLLESLKQITPHLFNCTDLFISPEFGVRTTNNVNEIAHYEFGAALASNSILKAMETLEVGISEMELGQALNNWGQRNSVVTIAAAGPRFINANLYPTDNKVKLGDKIALTVGYKGGLSSRCGYAVKESGELPKEQQDYLEKLVIPYYHATVVWLEKLHCGLSGGEIYQIIENVLPKNDFHWSLCPGHLTSDEEWLSSPIFENSPIALKSGMIMQLDIIPSLIGYAGVSAESTVVLADFKLREKIKKEYPQMWDRIQKRIIYIKTELNIQLHEDILPLASTLGYLRPYLLDKEKALKVSR